MSLYSPLQNEDYNTSDEEFEKQLIEATNTTNSPSDTGSVRSGKAKTKVGRGQGKPPKKKMNRHMKKTQKFPSDPDAEGYEVCVSNSDVKYALSNHGARKRSTKN